MKHSRVVLLAIVLAAASIALAGCKAPDAPEERPAKKVAVCRIKEYGSEQGSSKKEMRAAVVYVAMVSAQKNIAAEEVLDRKDVPRYASKCGVPRGG